MQVGKDEIHAQLDRILSSGVFQRSPHLSRLLQITVEQTLEGRADELKEYFVGSEVFGRGSSFDPRTDTIVRTQATRLRSALQRYYEENPHATVLIEYPKGSYVPVFRPVERERIPSAAPGSKWKIRPRDAIAATTLVIGLFAAWRAQSGAGKPQSLPPAVFDLEISERGMLDVDRGSVVMSPSGQNAVFPLIEPDGVRRLWIKKLSSGVSIPLMHTEGGSLPFWSPDEKRIAFFQAGKLKTYRLADAEIRELADAPLGRGGAWSKNGILVYAPQSGGPLLMIPAEGGRPKPATVLDAARGEHDHRWPQFLPDGRSFLYTVRGRESLNSGVAVAAIDAPRHRTILRPNVPVKLARTTEGDFLIYSREGKAWARPFDARSGQPSGVEFSIADGVWGSNTSGPGFSIAGDDYLVFHTSVHPKTTLNLYSRSAELVRALTQPGFHLGALADSRGKMLSFALARRGSEGVEFHIGELRSFAPVKFAEADSYFGCWEPDGQGLFFIAHRGGTSVLLRKSVVADGGEKVVWRTERPTFPTQASEDGRWLVFHEDRGDSLMDLSLIPLDPISRRATAPPIVVQGTKANETHGFLSRNGRQLAFVSDESGTPEIYSVELDRDGRPGFRRKVSVSGGAHPRWSKDDRELFYLSPSQALMSVEVEWSEEGVRFSKPVKLFDTLSYAAGDWLTPYVATPDGRHFVINTLRIDPRSTSVKVIAGWSALLKTKRLTVK